MIQIKLPVDKILNGGPLAQIVADLMTLADFQKTQSNGHRIYSIKDQNLVEPVLTETNVLKIVEEGGEILDYVMYAEVPFQKAGISIYEVPVPEGLPYREMKVTTGDAIVEAVKNLGQWCDARAKQTFSIDFKKIYLMTNPLGDLLPASELKMFVEGLGAKLLTRTEYNELTVID